MNRLLDNRWLVVVLGLTITFSAAGCGNNSNNPATKGGMIDPPKAGSGQQQDGQAGSPPAPATSAQTTVYPYKAKDATGKEFTFDKTPERIVSVSPSETEMLFALGLGSKVVGVSDFCDFPAEAKAKPKMGSIVKPNEEALIAANADIVLSGVSLKLPVVEQLRGLKVNVFKVDPKTLDDVMHNLLMFGEIFNRQEQAQKLVASMKADRQRVAEAVKNVKPEQRKKVFVEISPGWTVGKGEYIDELITLAGGINVTSDIQGYAQLNEEKVIAANPQAIIYPMNLIDDKSKKAMDQIIRERSGWGSIDAVKNNSLVGLDKDIMSRPGPRLVNALVDIAKGLYPELVNR